jgi:hypothetical protein
LGVTVEPATFAGVKAFVVTPKSVPEANRQYVLLHLHGGVRVFNPGEAGTREAILMAGFAGFKVIKRIQLCHSSGRCRPVAPAI